MESKSISDRYYTYTLPDESDGLSRHRENEIRPSFLASNYDVKCHNQSKFIPLSVSKSQNIYPYLFCILLSLQIGWSKHDAGHILLNLILSLSNQTTKLCVFG